MQESRPHNRLLFNIASILYIVMAAFHVVYHFVVFRPNLDTDKERTLYELMTTYSYDWGSGIMRSMAEVQQAFYLYMPVLLVGLAVQNLITLRHSISERQIMHSITLNFIVMTFLAGISFWRAYLVPMIIYGSCFLFIAVPFFRQLTKRVK